MRGFSLALALVAAAIQQAHGAIYITGPVGSSKCTAGSSCPINWNDDGHQPSLAQIGMSTIGLYVGSVQIQYLLQSITTLDVSKASNFPFTPQASVGANSDQYFIRFTSLNLTSTTNQMYPYEAFSSKFTLSGMTGQFNATLQQIMTNTASLSTGSSSQTTGTGGASSATSSPKVTNASSATSASNTSTSKSGGAVKLVAGAGSSLAVAASLLIVALSGLFTVL